MRLCQKLDNLYQSKTRRWVAIILGILELFWFSGYYYGFNSLIPAWKSLRVFAYNCSDTSNTCMYYDYMFGNGFVVWIVTQMCLITFAGLIMDKVGLRAMKLIAVCLYFIGTVLFAYIHGDTESLYFISGILVALGSTSNLICNHQITSMFPKYRGICISLLSGAFDSSTLIVFIFSKTYTQLSLQTSFTILAVTSLCVGLFMAIFILTTKSGDMSRFAYSNEMVENSHLKGRERVKAPSDGTNGNTEKMLPSEEGTNNVDVSRRVNTIIELRYQSLKDCILSLPFLMIAIWFTIGLFRFSTFLGQLQRLIYESFGDDEATVDHVLQISSAFSMCGFLAAPITGFILDTSQAYCRRKIARNTNWSIDSSESYENKIYYTYVFGLAPGLFIMAVCAVFVSGLVFIPKVIAFYAAFVFLVMLRSLLFSASVGFCLIAFPIHYFGTVNGILNTIGGVFSLLQYAFQYTPTASIANIIATVVTFGLFIPPIVLFKMSRR
uniref:MFS domain-containing protein n=1 Tax=Trichobilharzia regenti TaxID=157069 RepID=A0AA85KE28_TRIRE|nr:unnamed protein product [Trichobilharzia regenti]CAH8843360.1 unnamed protein product [Trichobilharzia regenti]CAH8843363.1 unnamed protein product [Trichobilharzia regenti]